MSHARSRPPADRLARTSCRIAALLCIAGAACTADGYERRADSRAQRILGDEVARTIGRRREDVRFPEPRAAELPAVPQGNEGDELGGPPSEDPAPPPVERRVLTLPEALDLAVRFSRDYKTQREALYLQALSLASTRHTFTPQLSATLGYIFADPEGLPTSKDAGFDASLDQVLPWGGNIGVGVGTVFSGGGSGDDDFASNAAIRLTQPLLRGAGYTVSHESLVQAERDLVYEIRNFELFREDFSIDVARRFYDLVSQKQAIGNQRQNLEGFIFGRRQAEALFEVGRTNELDVLRARRSELTSRDSFIAAEEDFELSLDRFRIFLGLPPEEPLDVDPTPPPFVPADFEVSDAVQVALENRLDLLTRKQQLEDVERSVRIARNGLLPDFGLSVNYDVSSGRDRDFFSQDFGDGSVSAGLTLELPVDRVGESNAYRAAKVGQARALRSFDEFRDNLVVEIQSAFRELERRRQSLDIQRQLITDQAKNAKIAQLRFEQGDFSNRDVVEAEEALLDARNSLISEQVNYEISRLQLLRDLGILFIDEQGMWIE